MAEQKQQEAQNDSSGQTEAPVEMGPVESADDAVIDALISGDMELPDQEPFDGDGQLDDEGDEQGDNEEQEQALPQQAGKVAELEQLLSRVDTLEKQTKGQEHLIQRQISRWGEARKQIQGRIAQLSGNLDELYVENPRKAREVEKQIEQAEGALQEGDAHVQELHRVETFKSAVRQHIKNDEYFPQEIYETLVEEGVEPSAAKAFVDDPISSGVDSAFAIQVMKRGRERKALKYIIPQFERLRMAFDQLRTENEQLKKTGGRDLLRKAEAVAKQPPRMNGKATTARKGAMVTPDDVHKLSGQELDELIAQYS